MATTLLAACAAPSVVTTWSSRENLSKNINHILVVYAAPMEDTILRRRVEDRFSAELTMAGYHATPSLTAFGPKGLAYRSQEETFIKLCTYGFDAVLTVTLLVGAM